MTGDAAIASPDSLPSPTGQTLPQLLARNAGLFGRRDAMREKSFGIWRSWTWADMLQEVGALARGLSELGVQRGDRVVLIGDNRPRLYWSMSALQVLGAVPVPLFPDIAPQELTARLTRVKARFAIVEGQEEVDNLLEATANGSRLAAILFDRPRGMRRYAEPTLHALDDIAARGDAAGRGTAWLEGEIAAGRKSDPAVILFTSGATGEPKPALLSHALLIGAGQALATQAGLSEREQVLAYLPMAWYADHVPSYVQAHIAGYCVSCPESGDTVLNDLREIGPTYFIAPSRLFEKIYREAVARLNDAGWFKRWLLIRFARHAPATRASLSDDPNAIAAAPVGGLLGEVLIRGPLRNALGLARLRAAYALGEALSPSADGFYRMIGADIRRCYGLVEAGGFVSAQVTGAASAGDLGPRLPGMEVKISESGELLLRPPAPFSGYDGEEITDIAEWFATGDAGRIDAAGNVNIVDRISAVGQLANATPFTPGVIEARLNAIPEIAAAMVLGRGRSYCAAILCLDAAALKALAETDGPERHGSGGEFDWLAPGSDLLQARLAELNSSLAGDDAQAVLQIRRFLVMPRDFSAAAGEVTRSRQLRRHVVEENLADLIEALYAETPGAVPWRGVAGHEEARGEGPDRLEIRDVPGVG